MLNSDLDFFLEYEQKIIDDLLEQHFGYYLLHFNKLNCVDTSASKISHHINYSNSVNYGTNLLGEHESMPLNSDSIDFVLMPHFLDYINKKSEQNDLLKEINRALRPDGAFLLSGFNKIRVKSNQLSNELVNRVNTQKQNKSNFKPKLMSLSNRVKQLNKKGFKIIKAVSFSLSLPSNENNKSSWGYNYLTQSKGMQSYFCLGYIILAKKNVVELLPLKPKWSKVSNSLKAFSGKKKGHVRNNINSKK